jgi:hypothetical protein
LSSAQEKIYPRNVAMDLGKVLTQLREELANLDAAILSLERVQQEGRRGGRPQKAPSEASRASRATDKTEADPDEPRAEEG